MNHGVFVLGMHRSGTSATTRLLTLLGVPTCIESDLLQANSGNPTGYWESESLLAFNDQLLARFDSDWSCPPALPATWTSDPTLELWRRKGAAVFARAFPTRQWVWKDPRNCTTFPFWLTTVSARPTVVLVYRNPVEIAASLAERHGLDISVSLALWERSVRSCLTACSGLRVLVTDFAEVLTDPLAWCERAREFLEASGVVTDRPDTDAVTRFVLRGVRSASSTDLSAEPSASQEQRELQAALESLRGVHGDLVRPALPPETPSTDAILADRRRLRALALQQAVGGAAG